MPLVLVVELGQGLLLGVVDGFHGTVECSGSRRFNFWIQRTAVEIVVVVA